MLTDVFRNGKCSRICEEFRICNIPGEEQSDCDDVLGTWEVLSDKEQLTE